MEESWLPVVGYEGAYEVSDLGHVRNCRSRQYGPKRDYLRPQKAGKAKYGMVNLHAYSRSKLHAIHRLVAAAFLGPCPSGYQVNHRDGNKDNNIATNLEYVTPRQNHQHAAKHGLTARGERNPMSKLTPEAVTYIRESAETDHALASRFGVVSAAVRQARLGHTWHHVETSIRQITKEYTNAKLDAETVKEIRASQERSQDIAKRLGLNFETVRKARLGQTWRDVGGAQDKANFGERHHNAKLTEDAVRFIRASADSNKTLASRFGVDPSVIVNVRHFKSWRHVV